MEIQTFVKVTESCGIYVTRFVGRCLIKSFCRSVKSFKSSFRSRENQILEFYILKFHGVIKCLSIKQQIHFTE